MSIMGLKNATELLELYRNECTLLRQEITLLEATMKARFVKNESLIEEICHQFKKKHLIIFGIPDQEQEEFGETKSHCERLFQALGCDDVDLDKAKRIGSFQASTSRPILVGLVRSRDKHLVLSRKKYLKEMPEFTSVFITVDKTSAERAIHKMLLKFAVGLRKVDSSMRFSVNNSILTVYSPSGESRYIIEDGVVTPTTKIKSSMKSSTPLENSHLSTTPGKKL